MDRYNAILTSIYVLTQLCVFLLILRTKLYRRVPVFASYSALVILAASLLFFVESNERLYFSFYWFADAIEMLLAMASIYEAFANVFKGFSRVRGFRWLFPAAIIVGVAYSMWATYIHPPLSRFRTGTILVSAVVDMHYALVCICLLFFLLAAVFRARWRLPEFGIVLGFGIEAAAFGLAAVVRSEFGTKYSFWSTEFPTIAYIASELVWVWAVWGRKSSARSTTPITPDPQLADDIRRQVKILKKYLGKH